jgi:hypothetical protein
MRKVLGKVKQENFCSIEDTMWLYKQKELLIEDENKCIKNLNSILINGDQEMKNVYYFYYLDKIEE